MAEDETLIDVAALHWASAHYQNEASIAAQHRDFRVFAGSMRDVAQRLELLARELPYAVKCAKYLHDLLATIHRDGGHTTELLGLATSVQVAIEKVSILNTLEARLKEQDMNNSPYGYTAAHEQTLDDAHEKASDKLRDSWDERIEDISEELNATIMDLEPGADADDLERIAEELRTYADSVQALVREMHDPTAYA